MTVVAIMTKATASAPTASQIMSAGGVVRDGGGDNDEDDGVRADSVTDYVSSRRGPRGWCRW